MSAEIGFGLAVDSVNAYKDENYRNLLMDISLLAKYVIKPGPHLMLEPYIGKSSLEDTSGETLPFRRYAIYLGVGYKYGFITRKGS
jgi:hypothetical protein